MALQWRRGSAASWTSQNPVLLDGQVGYERPPSKRFKVGDGVTAWNDLPYASVVPESDTDTIDFAFLEGSTASRIDHIHLRRAQADSRFSSGLVAEAQSSATWFEDWEDNDPDPSQWEVAGVAGGVAILDSEILYGSHVSLRPIELETVGGFTQAHGHARVSIKAGEITGGSIGIALTTGSASGISIGGFIGTHFIGIDATPGNEGKVLVRYDDTTGHATDSPAPGDTGVTASPGDGDWILGWSLDEIYGLCMYARKVDGSFERLFTRSVGDLGGWVPTKFGIVARDDRDESGSGVKSLGYRASLAPISPSEGLNGVGHTVMAGTRGDSESMHLIIPKIYTGEVSLPLIIHCHGGSGDCWDPMRDGLIDGWEEFAGASFFVLSGDFSNSTGNKYTAGSDEAIANVVSLYTWMRNRFNIGDVFLTGYSLGALTVTRTIHDGRVPVAAAIIGDGMFNFEWFWDVHETIPEIEAAWPDVAQGWGFDPNGDYAQYRAAVDPGDVWKYGHRRFRGIPIVVMTSTEDGVVDHTLNGAGWHDKLLAYGCPVARWITSGAHGQAGTWPASLMITFLSTIALTNGNPYGD